MNNLLAGSDSRSLNGNHESVDGENQSENIVYDPVDSEDVDEGIFM